MQITVAFAVVVVLAAIEPVIVPKSTSAALTVQAAAIVTLTLKLLVADAANAPLEAASNARPATGKRYLRM